MSDETSDENENIFATAVGKIIDRIEDVSTEHEGVLRIIFTNKDQIVVKFEIMQHDLVTKEGKVRPEVALFLSG